MARLHGHLCRAYLGARDISGDIASINPTFSAAAHDATTLGNEYIVNDPGLKSWECSMDGFYDPAAGGVGRQFEDLLGAVGGVLSIYDGSADAIGDTGILCSDGVLTQRSQPINVADLIKLSGTLVAATGGANVGLYGKLLHPLGEETGTGTEASLNHGGSTANGGRANLHITAITGTWTIKVEHSANDIAWADLATFSSKTAIGGSTLEVSGTVNQYLRASATEDVAGSATFVLGFARY